MPETIQPLKAELRAAQLSAEVDTLDGLIDDGLLFTGPDVVVVALRARLAGFIRGQSFAGDYRYTRVWARRDDSWRVVAGHVTMVTDGL